MSAGDAGAATVFTIHLYSSERGRLAQTTVQRLRGAGTSWTWCTLQPGLCGHSNQNYIIRALACFRTSSTCPLLKPCSPSQRPCPILPPHLQQLPSFHRSARSMTVAPQATAPAAPATAAAGGAAAAAAAGKQQSAATAATVGKQQEDESVAIFQRNWQVMVYIHLGKALLAAC